MFISELWILVFMWSLVAGINGVAGLDSETIKLQNEPTIIDCHGGLLRRDALKITHNITRLVVHNCSMPDVLHEELFTHNVTLTGKLELYDVGQLSATVFTDLQLMELTVHNARLSANSLSTLPALLELELSYVTSPRILHTSRLQRLSLRYCSLRRLPEELLKAKNLRFLDVSYNHIDYLEPNALLSSTRISSLDLSHNALAVQSLYLAHMHELANLNLSDNNIVKFSFQELRNSGSLVVDLRHNPVRELDFTEEDYKRLLSVETNLTVYVDSHPGLTCECLHGWLVYAINATQRVQIHNAHCSDEIHSPLQRADPKSIQCTYSNCVAEACSCRTTWYTGSKVLRCQALSKLPRGVPEIRALLARENNVTELTSEDLPDSLLLLDLSKNKIRHIDNETVSTLFGLRKRRVWLDGNPLACDCDNLALLEGLTAHKSQVFDYANIHCYNETGFATSLSDLDTEQLCVVDDPGPASKVETNTGLRLAAAAALGTLFLAVTVVILHARYGRKILKWLRAVGWISVRDDLDDDDRTYDIFVSFSHQDEEVVTRDLLPRLEKEYRVCVHFRDWVVGEWIPTQIIRSVAASRRTVVILSRNFAASQWARLEFRSALASAITDGIPRLAVIVLDDVILDDGLDDELTNYLRTNTYVRWGDPWFWHKLKVVLPKPRGDVVPPPARDDGSDGRDVVPYYNDPPYWLISFNMPTLPTS